MVELTGVILVIGGVIGLVIISMLVFRFSPKKIILTPYQLRELKIKAQPGFSNSIIVLKQEGTEEPRFTGYALDSLTQRVLLVLDQEHKIYRFDEILEWRLIVNGISIAELTRVGNAAPLFKRPDSFKPVDDILKIFCPNQIDPVLTSVVMKFLIRDLSYPSYWVKMNCDANACSIADAYNEAVGYFDQFKVLMYSDITHIDQAVIAVNE